jgi:hypothetical protein
MQWVYRHAFLLICYVHPRLTLTAGRNGGRKAGLSIYRGSALTAGRSASIVYDELLLAKNLARFEELNRPVERSAADCRVMSGKQRADKILRAPKADVVVVKISRKTIRRPRRPEGEQVGLKSANRP